MDVKPRGGVRWAFLGWSPKAGGNAKGDRISAISEGIVHRENQAGIHRHGGAVREKLAKSHGQSQRREKVTRCCMCLINMFVSLFPLLKQRNRMQRITR